MRTNQAMAVVNDGRDGMLKGVAKVSKAVTSTLGPRGRNVVVRMKDGQQLVTKDGVTVARLMRLGDPVEDAGAKFVQDAAFKTLLEAGDGTTTSVLMTYELTRRGKSFLAKHPYLMLSYNSGVQTALKNALNELDSIRKDVKNDLDTLEFVASISANNDPEIGKLIREAIEEVGVGGMVQTADSPTNKSYVEVVDGMEIDTGIKDYIYINNANLAVCEFKDPLIAVVDEDLSTVKQVKDLLNYVAGNEVLPRRPLVIVANEVIGEAEMMISKNKLNGKLDVCIVKAPGLGDRRMDYMTDLATFTGATIIGPKSGTQLQNFQIEHLGTCESFQGNTKKVNFTNGAGNKNEIADLITSIEREIETITDEYAINKRKARIQRLKGRSAILRIGAQTTSELGQLKDRVDDAIKATQSAIEEGVVPGGGSTYLVIADRIAKTDASKSKVGRDEKAFNQGYESLVKALQEPVRKIAENAGVDPTTVVDAIRESGKDDYGYDAREDVVTNMMRAGILNSAKVERVALENAVSACMMMLATECVIFPADEA